MEWHINDLSLSGQFANPQAFRFALEPLLRLRHHDPLLKDRLYCSRSLHTRKATVTHDIQNAIRATKDRTFIGLALEWWAKAGPFWDDKRQSSEDDYFEYQGADVTDQGLGEAARRKLVERDANAFSFPLEGFQLSPLSVQQGLAEEPIRFIDVANYWLIQQIEAALESCRALNNWNDVREEITRRYDQLIIAQDATDKLGLYPFSKYVTGRIFHLLSILNQLVLWSDDGGMLSEDGEEILRNYFAGTATGRTPLFKPETPDDRRHFKKDLMFRDPSNNLIDLFCHWHGKIQTPPIRIHFEWPRPKGQREIKVVYIGPKITKK